MEVRPDQVRAGVTAWDRAHAKLDEANRAAQTGITGVDPASVFGSDTPGRTFLASYLQNGGPAELLFGATGGGGVVTQLGEGGPSITTALDNYLSQEDANAAAVAQSGQQPPSARA